MLSDATPHPNRPSRWHGRPIYGYDLPVIQNHYIGREATSVADFFLPHLQPGMSLLDCGCGPGALTLGLAKVVAPGKVVGIDLEPRMIERAIATATAQQIGNVCFEVANICALPFADRSFDALFTGAVLEHLRHPGQALQELYRVLKPGGCIGIINTDWGEPLISPPDDAVRQFFALFERGFNHHGGSLNRGRHLRRMMRQAGFTVTDFSAAFNNATTPETIQRSVAGYVEWIDHLPLFEEAIALGWVNRAALDDMGAQMRRWSEHPDAFLALGRCKALGRKEEG
jgi:ubiquinone/menaquinone biosynthesis C-methylase UbiE